MKSRRIPAFTIMEMTIAMLLASIAIALTYTIYSIFAKTYNAYHQKNAALAVPIRLNELLEKDFSNATNILKTDSGLILKNNTNSVIYQVAPEWIIRSQTTVDTFKVKANEVETSFERMPILEVKDNKELNRIDELQFKLMIEDKVVFYHFFKQYSATDLIQRANAIN